MYRAFGLYCINNNIKPDDEDTIKRIIDDVKISILGDTCGLWGYSVADLNKDCVVDTADLAIFATYWLESGWID